MVDQVGDGVYRASDYCLCDGETLARWWMPLHDPIGWQVLCDACLAAERELWDGQDPPGLCPYTPQTVDRRRSAWLLLLELMSDGNPRTTHQIAAGIGSTCKAVNKLLANHPNGLRPIGRVVARRRGNREILYALPDASAIR